MSPTAFQKIAVDHVPFPLDANLHGQSAPLDYDRLRLGRFEAVYFRPEEGVAWCGRRIQYARSQRTWRDQPFDGNLWIADPNSDDSKAAGIPTDPEEWGAWVAGFVSALARPGYRPAVLKLNIEFTGKGYPPWRAATTLPPWSSIWAKSIDGVIRLFFTPNGGTTGNILPAFSLAADSIFDGSVRWISVSPTAYPYYRGWGWNERAAKTLYAALAAAGLSDQRVMIQPMANQADFNIGAWMSRGARVSPQCYGSQPYISPTDPGAEISLVSANHYVRAYYNLIPDRRRVHPTIGAYGQGWFYVPKIQAARAINPFGLTLFRHDGFADADYTAYAQFALT